MGDKCGITQPKHPDPVQEGETCGIMSGRQLGMGNESEVHDVSPCGPKCGSLAGKEGRTCLYHSMT